MVWGFEFGYIHKDNNIIDDSQIIKNIFAKNNILIWQSRII